MARFIFRFSGKETDDDFITRQREHTPVEGNDEGNAQPLKPHRWAVGVFAEDGAGGDTEGFHHEGKGVGDGQPSKQTFVFVLAVNGVEDESVEDEEQPVRRQLGNGQHGGQAVGQGSAGEGEDEEVGKVAVEEGSFPC